MKTKTLDTTMMSWVQEKAELRERNNKAQAYSKSVQRKQRKNLSDKAFAMLTLMLCVVTFAYVAIDAFGLKSIHANTMETVEVEQEYIVRYGTVDGFADNGDMIVVTNDGNEWVMADAPCYDKGTEVRVLFNSNLTSIATDDVIIDITVR